MADSLVVMASVNRMGAVLISSSLWILRIISSRFKQKQLDKVPKNSFTMAFLFVAQHFVLFEKVIHKILTLPCHLLLSSLSWSSQAISP